MPVNAQMIRGCSNDEKITWQVFPVRFRIKHVQKSRLHAVITCKLVRSCIQIHGTTRIYPLHHNTTHDLLLYRTPVLGHLYRFQATIQDIYIIPDSQLSDHRSFILKPQRL